MIRPIHDNVLLVLDPEVPEKSKGGVYQVTLQPKGKEAYGNRIGTVLAVGPGHFRPHRYEKGREIETTAFQPTTVREGQRVIVHTTAGDAYTYTKRQDMAEMYGLSGDSWEVRMVREDEILAVFEAEEGVAAE